MTGNSALLDTSIVVRHFRDGSAVAGKLAAYEELYLPQIALGELYYGAFRSAAPEKHVAQIERFLIAADVLMPDHETARIYGKIATQLARDGAPIPQNDIWIAALALQFGLPLATTDAHYQRLDGLTVLLW